MLETGFVLLSNASFDDEAFFAQLIPTWGITAEEIGAGDDTLSFTVDGVFCSLALMPAPIPGDEAVQSAQGNYYCSDAVEIAEAHQAHLMVTVMNGGDADAVSMMRLYSQIISSCLHQDNATGVYTSGTVFSADFYNQCCQEYLPDDMPMMVWVFIGMGQNELGNQVFTIGMEKFQKEEMEILNSQSDMQTLHSTMLSMCSYIISADLTLNDGDTIGSSADQKWTISRSDSFYAPSEQSLKIEM